MAQNAGFFAHTGLGAASFTSLAATTFATVLDQIVADVGAGVNGWTLHDDQRAYAGNYMIPTVTRIGSLQTIGLTNGATGVTGSNTLFMTRWVPNLTQISHDAGVTLFTVSATANDTTATLGSNFTGVTSAGYSSSLVEKAAGFIVLKCVGTLKTFYVQIIRPRSYADLVRVQAWETWDAATHTGTNPSNQEVIRAYQGRWLSTTTALYVMCLYPNAFLFWGGGDTGNTANVYQDFCYCGALDPVRAGDVNAIVWACSNQELSGFGPNGDSYNTVASLSASGGATMLRTVGGTVWPSQLASIGPATVYEIRPRGSFYLDDLTRPLLDDSGGCQLVDVDAYQQPQGVGGPASNEGCRGNVRYLRYPVGTPAGVNLAAYGPDAAGMTHLILKTSYPRQRNSSFALMTRDVYLQPVAATDIPCSGFAWTTRFPSTTNQFTGEIRCDQAIVTAGTLMSPGYLPRWFAIPIDPV